jgi:Glycosyl transferase family 2
VSERPLTYVVITPARNEAENLRRLAHCLAAQTVRPRAWIVVDNGSTDETPYLVRSLAWEQPWTSLVEIPSADPHAPAAASWRAFHAGLVAVDGLPDVIVKLDAAVSFERNYFARLLTAFAADPRLGIASGVCYEREHGSWEPSHATDSSVCHAARAYRRLCLQDVLPLDGWGADELKAQVHAWRTGVVDGLGFYHHTTPARRWVSEGRACHALGYRVSYLLLRAAFHARRDPRALRMIWGYASAAARREPRVGAAERAVLRERQRLRTAPARLREARGRRTAAVR